MVASSPSDDKPSEENADARPVLDWELAKRRTAGSEEILQELAELFLEEGPKLLEKLDEAVEKESAEEISMAGHKLKGSVEVFAAERAKELALRLENVDSESDPAETREVLDRLGRELSAVLDYLRGRVGGKEQAEGAGP